VKQMKNMKYPSSSLISSTIPHINVAVYSIPKIQYWQRSQTTEPNVLYYWTTFISRQSVVATQIAFSNAFGLATFSTKRDSAC